MWSYNSVIHSIIGKAAASTAAMLLLGITPLPEAPVIYEGPMGRDDRSEGEANTKESVLWEEEGSNASLSGRSKTRTNDKYRVVYSDHQRLELEREFHFSKYITIRRKAELAQALELSERQVRTGRIKNTCCTMLARVELKV